MARLLSRKAVILFSICDEWLAIETKRDANQPYSGVKKTALDLTKWTETSVHLQLTSIATKELINAPARVAEITAP